MQLHCRKSYILLTNLTSFEQRVHITKEKTEHKMQVSQSIIKSIKQKVSKGQKYLHSKALHNTRPLQIGNIECRSTHIYIETRNNNTCEIKHTVHVDAVIKSAVRQVSAIFLYNTISFNTLQLWL